jgi:hypothetical protein
MPHVTAVARCKKLQHGLAKPQGQLSLGAAPLLLSLAMGEVIRMQRAAREMELLERITYWMDRRYVDPLLALLLPGVGDVIGAMVGLLTVAVAVRMRAHPALIARMLIHLAADALLGSIPLIGPGIDFFYRAHTKNLELLRQRDVWTARTSDWLVVSAAGVLFLIALALPIILLVLLIRSL